MGTVYIARDPSVDPDDPRSKYLQESTRASGQFHTCAVKTFQDRFFDRPAIVERFVREGISWVELPRHNRVVFAHYINVIDGRPYLFLEYVDGPNLRQWIMNSRYTLAEACTLAVQICEGMIHLHEIGRLVHRDLKPDNILISGNAEVKITDLGISKAIDALSQSLDGRQTGNPCYMAPEQFHGESSTLSDVYSFGVVFHEMLTGQRPSLPRNNSLVERPDQLNEEVPRELSDIVLCCLAPQPRERYGSFSTIRDDISKLLKARFPESPLWPIVEPTNPWEIMLLQERESLTKELGPLPYASYLIGHSLACVGQYGDALKHIERMAHPDDGSSEAGRSLILSGHCLNAIGEYRAALQVFEHSLHTTVFEDRSQNSYISGQILGPNRGCDLPFVWAGMAYSWMRLGNRAEASKHLQQGVGLEQMDAHLWPTMWHPLVDSPEYEQRIEKDLTDVPELRMLWFTVKGDVLMALGRHDEAIRSYKVVLGVTHAPTVWRKLANAKLQAGDETGAREASAAEEKASTPLRFWPDRCTKLAGALEKVWSGLSLRVYDLALALDPSCAKAWNNKGYLLKRLGRYEEAIYSYRQAVAADSFYWVAWGNLSSVLGIVGQYRESLECSQKSLAINPYNILVIANKEHALSLLRRRI